VEPHRHDAWTPRVRTHHVFRRADAYAAGLSRRQVDAKLASRTWRYVVGNVMTHRDRTLTALDLVLAAGLARPGCLVLGRVAAAFHGAPVDLQGPVDIQIEARGRSVPSGFTGRLVSVDAPGITVVGGIARVAPRTWSYVDALATMPLGAARDLLAYLASRDLLTPQHLEEHLARHPRRRGNAQLRRLRARLLSGAMSEAEELLHTILRRSGLTGWEANVRIDLPGLRARVDVVFRAQKVVVEVDGRRAHADLFVDDRRRDAAFTAAGWRVVRVTWWDLVDRPAELVAQLRQILALPS